MRILIVDDEKNIRESIARYLELEKFEVVSAANGLSAQRVLQDQPFDAGVFDLKMPGMDGLQLLTWLQQEGPDLPVIMISAHGDIRDAVEAMRLGARDYIVKPFDPEELVIRLRRIVEAQSLKARVATGKGRESHATDLIGSGEAMGRIRSIIEKVAPTSTTVLITGESGVGKEVVARRIHDLSFVSSGPFVPVNIGGIQESLLESELFGHERGAFTGAVSQKPGMFELASHGTLFLDEIGDMPVHLQVKLLRVLQDRKIQRLGGTRLLPIDTRIIAATNRDLEQRVKDGSFREDLFYRLNVVHMEVPPLRERPGDIPELVGHFIEKLSKTMGREVEGIEDSALNRLTEHAWPGNIRELENMIERALIFAESNRLRIQDLTLPEPSSRKAAPADSLKDLEKVAIERALLKWEGNRTRAAEQLGISRRTLFNKIREYGMNADDSIE